MVRCSKLSVSNDWNVTGLVSVIPKPICLSFLFKNYDVTRTANPIDYSRAHHNLDVEFDGHAFGQFFGNRSSTHESHAQLADVILFQIWNVEHVDEHCGRSVDDRAPVNVVKPNDEMVEMFQICKL